jgi:hypothetical protein
MAHAAAGVRGVGASWCSVFLSPEAHVAGGRWELWPLMADDWLPALAAAPAGAQHPAASGLLHLHRKPLAFDCAGVVSCQAAAALRLQASGRRGHFQFLELRVWRF